MVLNDLDSMFRSVSLFLSFFVIAISHVNKYVNPERWDTTAYLGEANLIKNNGGKIYLEKNVEKMTLTARLLVVHYYCRNHNHLFYYDLIVFFTTEAQSTQRKAFYSCL